MALTAKSSATAPPKTPKAKPPSDAADNRFKGKKVVVTGTMETMTRNDITNKLLELGATVTGSVSSKTDLLVAGVKAGSKLSKAESLGIEVLTEDAFISECERVGVSTATQKAAKKAAAAKAPGISSCK